MKPQVILAIALVVVCGAAERALATTYDVRFCAEYIVDYEDRDAADWWNTTEHKTARGIHVRVLNWTKTVSLYSDYANLAGATDYVTLTSGVWYWVELSSDAMVANGNRVIVYNNDTDMAVYKQLIAFTPTYQGLVPVHFQNTVDVWESNVAAAFGYAVHFHPGGLSTETFTGYTQTCPGGGASCESGDAIYIHENNRNRRFVIAHETGHLVLHKRVGASTPHSYSDTGAGMPPIDRCTSPSTDHNLFSREYQSAGASEGIANFWAAAVWNDGSHADCTFGYKPFDWNYDGIKESLVVDCAANWNYMHTWCVSPQAVRSVELDWMTQWWDLVKQDQRGTGEIADIWVDADTQDWILNSQVYPSLRSSAINNGVLQAVWDGHAANHGIDH